MSIWWDGYKTWKQRTHMRYLKGAMNRIPDKETAARAIYAITQDTPDFSRKWEIHKRAHAFLMDARHTGTSWQLP